MVLKCLLVARNENSTGFSTGLTGRSKNLDLTGNPTGFRLWPTSSGPNPARTRKYKPEPGPNPKTNFKPKSCPRKPKVKLSLKNLAMLPNYFGYIFMP